MEIIIPALVCGSFGAIVAFTGERVFHIIRAWIREGRSENVDWN